MKLTQYIFICLIITLSNYGTLDVGSVPVLDRPRRSVLSSSLVSSICIAYTNFTATGEIQTATRKKMSVLYSQVNGSPVKWTKCRAADKGCEKFALTNSKAPQKNTHVLPNSNATATVETRKTSRVINGRFAYKNEFPWAVILERVDDCELVCGGTILDTVTVLTAVHCFNNIHSDVVVTAGEHIRFLEEGSEQYRFIYNITPHPTWDTYTGVDLGIIKVDPPFDFNEKVHAIPFTIYDPALYPEATTLFTVNGWGIFDESNTSSEILRTTTVPLLGTAECGRIQLSVNYNAPKWWEFCRYTGNPKRGTCGGDSGGGVTLSIGGQPHLVGVISHEKICAETPVAYVNMYTLQGWVSGYL